MRFYCIYLTGSSSVSSSSSRLSTVLCGRPPVLSSTGPWLATKDTMKFYENIEERARLNKQNRSMKLFFKGWTKKWTRF